MRRPRDSGIFGRMSEASAAERVPATHGALGTFSALLYVFLWASAFVPSRVLSRNAPPLWVLAVRFTIAGALLFAGVFAVRLPLPRSLRLWMRMALLGLCGNSLYLGLTYLALRHLSAGMGAILASTNPLLVALVAPRLLGEPLTPRKLAGLVLGFGGVLLAMAARAGTQTARPQDVLLAMAGVTASVASTVLYKKMTDRPHPVVLNAAQLASAGALMVPAALFLEGPPRIAWTAPVLASMTYLILVLSVGASMLWFWILRHGEASRVSAWYFLTPVFGLLLGAALLGERLVPLDAVALAVIAVGLTLVAPVRAR